MRTRELAGKWFLLWGEGNRDLVTLPGTMDGNGLGYPDSNARAWHADAAQEKEQADSASVETGAHTQMQGKKEDASDRKPADPILTRLTRRHTYTGEADYCCRVELSAEETGFLQDGGRIFLDVERTRRLTCRINGQEVPAYREGTLSTPYTFELTRALRKESYPSGDSFRNSIDGSAAVFWLELCVDNSYRGWPAEDIMYSSAATDETQTNWNGILGRIALRLEKPDFVSDVRVICLPDGNVRAEVDLDVEDAYSGSVRIGSPAFRRELEKGVAARRGRHTIGFAIGRENLAENLIWWDIPEYLADGPHMAGEHTAAGRTGSRRCDAGQMAGTRTTAGGPEVCRSDGPYMPVEQQTQAGQDNVNVLGTALYGITAGADGCEDLTKRFGLRRFSWDESGHFTINGRRIFVRSETNCALFPETGHPPMDTASWRKILSQYQQYGINMVRFHSNCPPEAAFAAADELGMLMAPELSCWNYTDSLESDTACAYYGRELREILMSLANHPSFVTLTLGNEVTYQEKGLQHARALVREARKADPSRMYSIGSNAFYGARGADPEDDFYMSFGWHDLELRGCYGNMTGFLNQEDPAPGHSYDEAMEEVRRNWKRPVMSFEVGEYEILPDFARAGDYRGVTQADNIVHMQQQAQAAGLYDPAHPQAWENRRIATGDLAALGYRAELEAAVRTEHLAGINLLGLQDFTGQGTALVGLMDSHLRPKKGEFSAPARLREVCADVVPLLELPGFTYRAGDTVNGSAALANYGREEMSGTWEVLLGEEMVVSGDYSCRQGCVKPLGTFQMVMPEPAGRFSGRRPERTDGIRGEQTDLTVVVTNRGSETYRHTYPVWYYQQEDSGADLQLQKESLTLSGSGAGPLETAGGAEKPAMGDIVITEDVEEALRAVEKGRRVLLMPSDGAAAFPHSMETKFTTDFWSVVTFQGQEGYMGILVNPEDTLLSGFPTKTYAEWQWWEILHGGRGVILPPEIRDADNHIEVLDCAAHMRRMSALFTCRVAGADGVLCICGLELLHKRQYTEADALLRSILRGLSDPALEVHSEPTAEELRRLIHRKQSK